MSIAIIINPISGGARPDAARARARARAARSSTRTASRPRCSSPKRVGHARELAKAAVARGARLVIAWGGDGTINEVASALAFGEVPLGIMPAGSGNGLARELGVDPRPERAIADALRREPRPIDVGEIDGRLFVNIAGIGFDAHVAVAFDAPATAARASLGYVGITARALTTYVPRALPHHDGGRRPSTSRAARRRSPTRRSSATAPASRRARASTTGCWIWWWWRSARASRRSASCRGCSTGRVDRVRGCSIRADRARSTIEADQPMTFHVDGEPVQGGTRLRRARPSGRAAGRRAMIRIRNAEFGFARVARIESQS